MAKPGARRGSTSFGQATRHRIVEAAIETLKAEGFAGTSARAIAAAGGFNQAVIFYHFSGVNDLLLAALDETSRRRMERYQEAVQGVGGLSELVRVASEIYREDLESGHITVMAEMISGSSTSPELGAAITERVRPWIDFTEEAIRRVLGPSPLAGLVPVTELAFAIVSLYLGVELLTHLDGDRSRAESLFRVGSNLVPLVEGLLGLSPPVPPATPPAGAHRGKGAKR